MRGLLERWPAAAPPLEIRGLLVDEAMGQGRPVRPMKISSRFASLLVAAAPVMVPVTATVTAAAASPPVQGPKGPLESHVPPTEPGIAWFGTWAGALEASKRSGRPILFMSAAPQCQGVPGVW